MNYKHLLSKFKKDEKGVFGLNAVQQFFVIILGIALLAYVIIIIMGTLSGTTILESSTGSATETGFFINDTGYTLGQSSLAGFTLGEITIINDTGSETIVAANYTITNNVITNATANTWDLVNATYAFTYDSAQQQDLDGILTNTSEGISGFFSSISPVYAILAILVIILVLLVLVRIVQAPNGGKSGAVQL